jgi:hypothetical protein
MARPSGVTVIVVPRSVSGHSATSKPRAREREVATHVRRDGGHGRVCIESNAHAAVDLFDRADWAEEGAGRTRSGRELSALGGLELLEQGRGALVLLGVRGMRLRGEELPGRRVVVDDDVCADDPDRLAGRRLRHARQRVGVVATLVRVGGSPLLACLAAVRRCAHVVWANGPDAPEERERRDEGEAHEADRGARHASGLKHVACRSPRAN